MNKRFYFLLSIALTSLLIVSCKKNNGDPVIKFVTDSGFTAKDTLVKVGHAVTIGLDMTWNGVDQLDQLEAKANTVNMGSYAITGETSRTNLSITKGTDETEDWSFVLTDKAGNKSEVSLILTKDPNSEFGAITYYTPVILGAQNNTVTGGFISFQVKPATTYTLEGAFINQTKVDILYFADTVTHSTLAGPGSGSPEILFPGSRNITLWQVKNATKFQKSAMTVQDFNNISIDAPIVSAWSDSQAVSKAVDLKVDDIWLVKLVNGKLGAILVKRIVAAENGEIEFSIKIQQ